MRLSKRYWTARIRVCLEPGEESSFQLESVLKDIAKQSKPKKFSPGPGSVLIEHVKEFERLCALIEKSFSLDAKKLTLFEFISRLHTIRDDIKAQSEAPKQI